MANTLHKLFVIWMLIPFPYFISAGGKTFTVPKLRDTGAVLGQLSFASGMMCVVIMGLYYGLHVLPAICGAIFDLVSVLLYEWTRRTVVDRNFYVGLGGEVPAAVCDAGPYRWMRHPFYLSYILAFLGVAIAFPSPLVAAVCLLNIGLFVYMAHNDERTLMASILAPSYESYKMRVGMFLPRFKRET
jgi:protein-S-isoprenylcysteine O-methyltransferase Ste14